MPELTDREKDFEEKVLEAGKWITIEFLQDILSENEKSDKIKIIEKNVSPAVGLGNNFLSTLHRVVVKFCENGSNAKEKHLIIKQFPRAQVAHKFLNELSLFEKEIFVYTQILPKLNDIFKEFSEEPFVAPVSYSCPLENILIMEDLKVQGYKIMDRQQQLPFDHCVEALKSLARLQVLSLISNQRHPGTIESVTSDFYTEKSREHMEPFMLQMGPIVGELCEDIPELKKFSKAVTEFGTIGYNILMDVFEKASQNFLQVFCHGDMWLTNIMFKHDQKDRVLHAKFVDFQLSRKSSPAVDVLHMLFTSAQPQVLSKRWDELIRTYYNAFQEDLKLFGLKEKHFTLEEFHRELERLSAYAFHLIIVMLPNVLSDMEDVIDMDAIDADTFEMPEGGNSIKQTFRKQKSRDMIIQIYNHFDRLGYMEQVQKALQDFR